ncbi:hypothetical protein HFO56_24890 [Rhizobium laguerreae]|uniref:hypothetical protein n=1 Tax=Rhizobium laguerreae TaxID=1076926 RepID=UPI001C91559E|nr:hypothetical protein [Rhizobium laguerreae]MBY3155567.1 hypothetical protein [Rhizobium laguerreae]
MKLEVEFPLILRAVPPRASIIKDVVVKDVVTVEIPEFSASEALLAMRVTGVDSSTQKPFNVRYHSVGDGMYVNAVQPEIEAGRVRYEFGYKETQRFAPLFHNDLHCEAQTVVDNVARTHKSAAAKHIFPEVLAKAHQDNKDKARGKPPVQVSLPMFKDLKFPRIDDQDVDRARAAIMCRIDDLVIVDGKFMLRRPEPVYLADASTDRREPAVFVKFNVTVAELRGAEKIRLDQAYFAADDLEGVLAYAAEMWRIKKQDDQDYEARLVGNPIEVLDPAGLRFDGDRISVIRAAEAIRRNFMETILPQANGGPSYLREAVARNFENTSLEAIVNYKHLEAALKPSDGSTTTDELCGRIRDCMSGSEAERFANGLEASMLEVAIGRWERREARRNFGLIF